ETAANTTRQGATHEEARPENDKDTRALEAPYLARGQAQRVVEVKQAAARLDRLTLRNFEAGAAIRLSALVTIERYGERRRHCIVSAAGGVRVHFEGEELLRSEERRVGKECRSRGRE